MSQAIVKKGYLSLIIIGGIVMGVSMAAFLGFLSITGGYFLGIPISVMRIVFLIIFAGGVLLLIFGLTLTKEKIDIKSELGKASKTYDRVHYKTLANVIGCSGKVLLQVINDMVSANEMEATVEAPYVTFKK